MYTVVPKFQSSTLYLSIRLKLSLVTHMHPDVHMVTMEKSKERENRNSHEIQISGRAHGVPVTLVAYTTCEVGGILNLVHVLACR